MTSEPSEILLQVTDFEDPTILDVFEHERIFDVNGIPYIGFSPSDYLADGPQLELSNFPTDDITGRKDHGGLVNATERRNAQEYFGETMNLLRSLRQAYVNAVGKTNEPLTYADVLNIAHMGIELPRYLLWKQDAKHMNGSLPSETILLNSALRGFYALVTAQSWLYPHERQTDEQVDFILNEPYSKDDSIDFLLKSGRLEKELVCVAHWNMVTEMFSVIEGKPTETTPQISPEIEFDVAELLDFSKSLRTIWENIYPNLETGINKLTADEDLLAEDLPEFSEAYKIAKMANFLVLKVMGREPTRNLDIDEIIESLYRYAHLASERETELQDEIVNYRIKAMYNPLQSKSI